MKRLPLLAARTHSVPRERSVVAAAAAGTRARMERPLVAVFGPPESAQPARFARCLIEAMQAHGAATLELSQLSEHTLRAAAASPPDATLIGLGRDFALRFETLLSVWIAPTPVLLAHGAMSAGADLNLALDHEGVAVRLGEWLAMRRLASA